jgi:hypothetical protein
MKIVEQSYEILSPAAVVPGEFLANAFVREAKLIERAGRTERQSGEKITSKSYDRFIRDASKAAATIFWSLAL